MVAVCAALLFCGLVFCAPNEVFARTDVNLEIEYGYDNTAKGGRYLPLSIGIENPSAGEVAGTLQIKSMESDGSVYRYDFPASVSAEEDLWLEKYIPLGTRASRLYVSFVREDGEVLASERIKLNISLDVPELFIGLLSDDPQDLHYLDGVGVSYSTLRTRTFDLDADDFPEDEIGPDLLDVLVVNAFKLRSLSESQTAAIMDWVHSGGVLLLGTGARVDDTLGRFAPELLDASYGSPRTCMVNLAEGFVPDESDAEELELTCVDIPLHGGNVIISSGGLALLTETAKEQGLIAVTAFDLAEIGVFCSQQTSYVDYFLTSLLGDSRIDELAELTYGGDSSRYWSVQSLINTGSVEKLPRLELYAAVILVYLLLLGPGLYLFLWRRGLQLYYRSGVIGLSLIFAVVIYLLGSTTRFRSLFYSYATIIDADDDYVTDTTFVNIRNPYNRPYLVELQPGYSVQPITRSRSSGDGSSMEFAEEDAYQIAIYQSEDRLTIQGQNIEPFAPRYFQLMKKSDNTEAIGISGEVDYFEGEISGYITNYFPYVLEKAALILYGNMVYLGRLEPGETKSLDDLQVLRFPLNNSYVISEWISGERAYAEADIDDAGYLLAMKRSGMLKFYLDTYLSSYTADARVIAFGTDMEESQFLVKNAGDSYGQTMVTSALSVNASRDRLLYRSVLMKTPEVVSGQYDARTNSMTGSEPLTLEYQLGTDISVESLTFESISNEFLESESGSPIEIFSGNIYFYNYGSGNFDRMETEGRTLDIEELDYYLSPGNRITVRYVYEGARTYGSIQLPMPMVAGREE